MNDNARTLRVEQLEPRLLLAGDTYLFNFQLDIATTPNRYIADVGEIFGDRGNGLSFGWSSDHTDVARDRSIASDQRLDTLIHFHQGQNWEFAVPNGLYEVTAAIGDAEHESAHTLNVEDTNYWNGLSLRANEFLVKTLTVSVTDGRLTLDQGLAEEKATRINYLHVVNVPSVPNAPPDIPMITEPVLAGEIVNPADVHMEAVGFSDSDGDQHLSTDWEIWRVATGSGPERVWQTLGIEGVERLHTHLGDGVFEGSRAGETSLQPNTDHQLRVRFRDDAGAVSDYATRHFRTDVASSISALEIKDILSNPAPTWRTAEGTNVELPNSSPFVPQFRVEAEDGRLLLSIAGTTQVGNSVFNPAPLAEHAQVRIVLTAGSGTISLGATDLEFVGDTGLKHTVLLPAINLTPDQRLDLWVAFDGSTYFGNAAQTEPDFSLLARGSEAPVPFVALQPGFEIDTVASDFQLPVNIAFVPNPDSDPSDPLFYVNELYGTIKVVANDFTVSTYATGLLNFNPTGSFPGSGEQGLAGLVVDPASGDLFVTRVTDTDGLPGGAHHPQVIRLSSSDGGRTASNITVLLDMVGESQGQSHQISNASIGPDGKLYIHNGDGFDSSTALNLDSYRGKILRLELDGSVPTDNPFYNAADGINSRDYIFAYGFRNPFGGAWSASDGQHYTVENGNSLDRIARVDVGGNYDWNGSDSSLLADARYIWNPAHAPVNITFVQPETFVGSQFPQSKYDRAFVSESGPTYATGPQFRGKRIVEFQFDANGDVLGGPTTLVEYAGTGQATVVAIAAGPDGLYFSEFYKDEDAVTPIDAGARIFRVSYVPTGNGDFDMDGDVDGADFLRWQRGQSQVALSPVELGQWKQGLGSGAIIAASQSVGAESTSEFVSPGTLEALSAPPTATANELTNRRETGLVYLRSEFFVDSARRLQPQLQEHSALEVVLQRANTDEHHRIQHTPQPSSDPPDRDSLDETKAHDFALESAWSFRLEELLAQR